MSQKYIKLQDAALNFEAEPQHFMNMQVNFYATKLSCLQSAPHKLTAVHTTSQLLLRKLGNQTNFHDTSAQYWNKRTNFEGKR